MRAPKDASLGVQFHRSGRKLSLKQLERECQSISGVFLDLPDDYKAFMLLHNGGQPDPSGFVFRGATRAQEAGCVRSLCSVTTSDNDPFNLRGANDYLARSAIHIGVPCDCIAIGHVEDNDHILLFVRGKKRGQVWLKVWDDVSDDPDPTRDTNPKEGLYRLAMSFNKFLESLCTLEEAERNAARKR